MFEHQLVNHTVVVCVHSKAFYVCMCVYVFFATCFATDPVNTSSLKVESSALLSCGVTTFTFDSGIVAATVAALLSAFFRWSFFVCIVVLCN